MNYYPFHIGDYRSGTSHLSDAEDLAYRRALDWYYDTETAIPLDTQWVSRRLRVETQVLENVLRDFFFETQDGWRHARCDAEIAAYQKLRDKNRANGAKGGRRPKQIQPNGNPVGSQSDSAGNPLETEALANQEPRTKNQEPDNPHSPQGGSGGIDLPEPHQLGRSYQGNGHPMAGAACLAIKQTGVGIANPSHPKLNVLLHAGVTIDQIVSACSAAVAKGKNFSYALSIAEREAEEARALAAKLPPASEKEKFAPSRYGTGSRSL